MNMLKKILCWIAGVILPLCIFGAWWLLPFFGRKAEWISALAAVVSAIGVMVVWMQLKTAKAIAQLEFEDGLAKEYRELISGIPTKAFLGSRLSKNEYADSFDELFRYIDLSNEQVFLRQAGRIDATTWKNWSAGIQYNLSLPAFRQAWEDVKKRSPKQFSELKELESKNFSSDPRAWLRRTKP